MIFWYKNSFLASVVSILGCVFMMCAIMGLVEGEPAMLLLALIGIPLLIWARQISNNKAFKKWWKQIEDKHLEPQIAQSAEFAMMIYNKNPQKRTLKKISQLNPVAAQWIEKNIADQKAAKKK